MITTHSGHTWVHSKHYAEGRLEMWGRCEPQHAKALDHALRVSVTTRPHILEAKFFAILAESGVPREAGEALLNDLREEDVVLLRPAEGY